MGIILDQTDISQNKTLCKQYNLLLDFWKCLLLTRTEEGISNDGWSPELSEEARRLQKLQTWPKMRVLLTAKAR